MSGVATRAREPKHAAAAPARGEAEHASPAPGGAPAGVPLFLRRSPAPASPASLADTDEEGVAEALGVSPDAIQTKLIVGAPDDPAEREAEAVAQAVVSSNPGETSGITSTSSSSSPSPRGGALGGGGLPGPGESGIIRREMAPGAAPAPATTSSTLSLPGQGPGTPMSPRTRGALESSLGADLGGVRVHRDAPAAGAAQALGARAFAVGSDIWLGAGESDEDLGLMAHETAHVLQGGSGTLRRAPKKGGGTAAPPKKGGKKKEGDSGEGGAKKGEKGGKEAKGGKKGEKGGEKGGAEAGAAPAKGEASAGLPVEPLMPAPSLELSPGEEARVGRVEKNAGERADAQAELPPAEEQVGDARAAVTEPVAETEARSQQEVVETLDEREPPSPEIEELCQKIRKAIRDRRPPDEDSLVEAKPAEMANEAGTELNTAVEGDTERVQGSYDAIEEPPAGEPQQEGGDITPQPPAAEVPVAGAARAAPDAVPAEEVSLDADVEASAAQMEEAGMETEPAQLVEDGPIAEARDAQGELGEMAARDPAEVLAEQQTALESSSADMAELQAKAFRALATARGTTATGATGQKEGMVETEQQMRERISKQAKDIFTAAQTAVKEQLDPLPGKAMKKWEDGKQVLSTRFEQSLARVKKWIDERHEGVGGAIVGVWDAVTGLPDWVTDEYDRAEKEFGDGICDLAREISSDVNTVVATCEKLIETARTQIAALFTTDLPDALKEWAAQEQASFGEQLDGLADQARKTRDDFNKDLAERAANAVQEARQKIHALREAAGGLLGKIANAIAAFIDDPAKFIIEGLLKLLGIEPSSFWAVVAKVGDIIDQIADDPLGFVNNALAGLAQGFSQFFDNFGTHLVSGFFDWLFSGLGSVGVQIPADFSLKSIITFALQLMGISWERIRRLLAKHIGEENVALLEKAYELISTLIEQGPEGIFELLADKLDPQQIISQIIEAGVQFLVEALIKAVSVRLLAMLNPAGAIVAAIEAIYRVLKWVFENAARIFSLIEAVVNGMAAVVAGNVAGMAAAVEGGLAKLIAPVIDFLADYIGLGDLPEKIADVIRGFQGWVEGILDRVIGFLAEKAKSLLKSLGLGGEDKEKEERDPSAYDREVGRTVPFGGGHRVFVKVSGPTVTVMVASDPTPVSNQIGDWQERLDADPALFGEKRPEVVSRINAARKLLGITTDAGTETVKEEKEAQAAPSPENTQQAVAADDKTEKAEEDLSTILAWLFTAFNEDNVLDSPIYKLLGTQLVVRGAKKDDGTQEHDRLAEGVKAPEGYSLPKKSGKIHIQRNRVANKKTPEVHLDENGILREGPAGTAPPDLSYLATEAVKKLLAAFSPADRSKDALWVAVFATAGVRLTVAPAGGEPGPLTFDKLWSANPAARARAQALAEEAMVKTIQATRAANADYAKEVAEDVVAATAVAIVGKLFTEIAGETLYFIHATDVPRYLKAEDLVRARDPGVRARIREALYQKVAAKAQEAPLGVLVGEVHHVVPLYLGGGHRKGNLARAVGSAFIESTGHELMHRLVDETAVKLVFGKQEVATTLHYSQLASKIPDDAAEVFLGVLYSDGVITYHPQSVPAPKRG